jgi:signal transduction histidine kinase
MISHDLRSPLTVIVGYLDMLSTELPEPTREKAITSARSSAVRMESMLDDLLSATRAEELFAPKVLLPVPLCDLADDIAVSMRATTPDHTIVVVCRKEQVALGEEKRLRQALVNVVANAIKYSPADTTITIAVEGGRDSSRAAVVVEDEGPGIPDDQKRTVFDRFTRVEGATLGKPGLGLGLYIVKVIAEGHGGRAYVEDGPVGGARFVMEIPATAQVKAETKPVG